MDVDYVLTTREISKMIYDLGIDFPDLAEQRIRRSVRQMLQAQVLYSAPPAALWKLHCRTVADILTGESADNFEYEEVRGLEGIKIANVKIADLNVRAAVAHGLGNARKLMDAIRGRRGIPLR